MRRSTFDRSVTSKLPRERSSNSAMSFSRTWESMNWRNGSVIAPNACSCEILLSISGCSPSRQALSKVGAMTKKVMNSDRLISTRLAGALCSPRPVRRNDSATVKRVKLVTMISRPGATESTVSTAAIWMMRAVAVAPPLGTSWPRSTVWAAAAPAVRVSASAARARRLIAPPACG